MAARPTNGELAIMIQGLTQEVRDGHNNVTGVCAEIKQQVQYTNGRVRKLEQWKYAVGGAILIINIIFVPIIVQWLKQRLAP